MDPSRSTSHSLEEKKYDPLPSVHINNVQLPPETIVKYLGPHLDRRFTWHKHIFAKRKQRWNTPHQNVLVTRTQVKTLYKQQTSLIQSNTKTNLDLRNTTLGYGFQFQHRNFGTFPVKDRAHDNGRTSVRAEYGYPKGSPNTNSFFNSFISNQNYSDSIS
jgi:hypothetical protein